MEVCIQGTGSISPQGTHQEKPFLQEPRDFDGALLRSEEPTYKEFVPPREARRMSRLVKMGLSAARMSLDRSGLESPEAIVTGTGLGCMEETEKFLLSMIDENEQLLNPSPFIRSTHNSIGGQLAISLGCTGYNHTYVHRGLSFPSAIMDGSMLLGEGELQNVLVGGFDEMTDRHFHVTGKTGKWKMDPIRNTELFQSGTPGSIAGEGAQFFLLSGERNAKTRAVLKGVSLFYDPDAQQLDAWIERFLKEHGVEPADVDAVLYGFSGDVESDPTYFRIREEHFPNALPLAYKHLYGESYTADSFGLWAATESISRKQVPEALRFDTTRSDEAPRTVLVYDHFFNKDHALYLLTE